MHMLRQMVLQNWIQTYKYEMAEWKCSFYKKQFKKDIWGLPMIGTSSIRTSPGSSLPFWDQMDFLSFFELS